MTSKEAAEWLNEIIRCSANCDRMSIDDERLEAITVARDVLEAMEMLEGVGNDNGL